MTIEVLQGGTSKGTFEAYSGAITGAANYNKSGSSGAPINGPGDVSAEEQIFFYYDTTLSRLSFSTIFRKGTGGNLKWDIAIDSTGNQTVDVTDDSGEFKEIAATGMTENFTGRWNWISSFTDGGVIGGLLDDWVLTITPISYNAAVGTEDIQVYDASGSKIGLAKNTTQTIVFRAAAVPETGTTVALLLLGLGALSGFRRRFCV